MIDDAKIKARQNSVSDLIDAVNMAYTKSLLTESPLKLPLTATIENGVVTILNENNNPIEVEYTGSKPESGTIIMNADGDIVATIKYSDNYECSIFKNSNVCTKYASPSNEMVSDPNEITRLIYRGENPNNYISLKEGNNNVLYRIVAIETDGTVKVMRNDIVTSMPYDSRTTETTGPRLNGDNTYCRLAIDNRYYGCNAWSKKSEMSGNLINGVDNEMVTQDSTIKKYLNQNFYDTLSETVKSIIVNYIFKLTPSSLIGSWGDGKGLGSSTLYVNNEDSNTWIGKIGLIELRDWFNATTHSECDPEREDGLGGGYYNSTANTYACSKDNYMYLNSLWWTLSPYAFNRHGVFFVSNSGFASTNNAYSSLGVRPTFYLSPNITLSGNGTIENPYKIN